MNRVFGLLDQALSSAQNFTLLIIVARSANANDFGAFAVAFAAAMLVVGFGQAVLGEASLIRLSGNTGNARKLSGAVLTLSVGIGLVTIVIFGLLSLAMPGELRMLFQILSVTTVGLLVQDVSRFLLIGQGRASKAFLADATWTAAWLGGILTFQQLSVTEHFTIWAGTALVGAMIGVLCLHPEEPLRSVRAEATGLIRTSKSLLFEWAALSANAQLLTFCLAGVVGLSAIGGLRAAQSLFGPVNTLINAIRLVFIREMAERNRDPSSGQAPRMAVKISIVSAMLASVVSLAVFLAPASLGIQLYGPTWILATPMLLPIAIQRIAGAAAAGPFAYLRGAGFVEASVRAIIIGVTIESVLAVTFAPFGIMFAAYGMALGTIAMSFLLWYPTVRAFRFTARGRYVVLADQDDKGVGQQGRSIGIPTTAALTLAGVSDFKKQPGLPVATNCQKEMSSIAGRRRPARTRAAPKHRRK